MPGWVFCHYISLGILQPAGVATLALYPWDLKQRRDSWKWGVVLQAAWDYILLNSHTKVTILFCCLGAWGGLSAATAHTTADTWLSPRFIYGINSSKPLRIWITVSSRLCHTKADVSALTKIRGWLFCCVILLKHWVYGVAFKCSYNAGFHFQSLEPNSESSKMWKFQVGQTASYFLTWKLMFRRSVIISTAWLSFSPPKQCTLHVEKETATFVFGIFFGSMYMLFVKYTWT